jgi:hypothetical protein
MRFENFFENEIGDIRESYKEVIPMLSTFPNQAYMLPDFHRLFKLSFG